MGKKGRKTRWRTLTITDEQSDSDESHAAAPDQRETAKSHAYYQQNKHHPKLPYSSHSTPTRRYAYDQSTRSSSTASENKITFNEDEYTKITTPRQDVLFKKGYLNKPKKYMTQTSTGNSTISTGNSTGNGTPDHHSADGTEGTDLEYETSQFVYPNGFVDQNGIYYINSYEPYPLVVYNAPFCFPEYQNVKTKRYSTGSLTESVSPNPEEVTDLNHEVPPNNLPEYGPVYNVVYPGFYYNGGNPCQENDGGAIDGPQQETRRLKKRTRRKLSKTKQPHDGATSEYTDECETSEDEKQPHRTNGDVTNKQQHPEGVHVEETSITVTAKSTNENSGSNGESNNDAVAQSCDNTGPQSPVDSNIPNGVQQDGVVQNTNCDTTVMTSLKVDAQEFVPRAYRQHLEYVNYHHQHHTQPNLVPLPFIPAPNFIPPLQPIPINFIPQFIPNATPPTEPTSETDTNGGDNNQRVLPTPNETLPRTKPPQSDIDIEKIVLKLEEAAKEQQLNEKKKKKYQKVRPTFEKKRYQKPPHHQKQPPEEFPREQPKPPVYADMLKKTQKYQRHEQKNTTRVVTPTKMAPTPEVVPETKATPPKAKSQWISVSNRKKRKNKTPEETDEIEEADLDQNGDEFESYDVSMLVDIVPPSSIGGGEEESPIKETMVEKIEEDPKVVEDSAENANTGEGVPVEEHPKELNETPIEVKPTEVAPTKEVKVAEIDTNTKKKKGKKTPPKTKRIIITDAVFVVQPEKEPTITQGDVVEQPQPQTVQVEDTPPPPKSDVQETTPLKVLEEKDEKDKKSKKKKKKPTPKIVSTSSSNTTLNLDDSYDFLIDGSVLNTEDKTNVEMSQEIDRMIQKGMYNSLEEKIKSLDIGFLADGFFKSVAFTAPKPAIFDSAFISRKSSSTKSSFGGFPTTPNKGEQPKPSTSKSGDFFESASPPEGDGEDKKKTANQLYPITRAVREWMDKTRETTPEVEILKSPSTIYKEFCESDEEAENDRKTPEDTLLVTAIEETTTTSVDDDKELTLFTQGDQDGDLLECWEDEISPPPPAVTLTKRTTTLEVAEKTIEKAEDVLEIYESKYGKNEDYLQLKAEIEEKMKTYPKHGNLPYRAICCNIM